jgi:hypothetical protein
VRRLVGGMVACWKRWYGSVVGAARSVARHALSRGTLCRAARWSRALTSRYVDRPTGLKLLELLNHERRVERVGVVEIVLGALLQTQVPERQVVVVVADVHDAVAVAAQPLRDRLCDRCLAGAGAAGDADEDGRADVGRRVHRSLHARSPRRRRPPKIGQVVAAAHVGHVRIGARILRLLLLLLLRFGRLPAASQILTRGSTHHASGQRHAWPTQSQKHPRGVRAYRVSVGPTPRFLAQ